MQTFVAFIRTVFFKILFYGLTALFVILMMAFIPFVDKETIFRVIAHWCAFLFWIMRYVTGVKVRWHNIDQLPKGQPYILSSKHESTIDAFTCVHRLSPLNAIAKEELFRFPLLGFIVRKLDLIPVRRNTGEAHKTLPDINAIIAHDKRPLLIFPEGTRVKLGERKKLKTGAFHVQDQTRLPVYTVASNAGCFWARDRYIIYPGTVIYEVHPEPIHKGLGKEAFLTLVEKRLFEESDKLRPNWCKKTLCDRGA